MEGGSGGATAWRTEGAKVRGTRRSFVGGLPSCRQRLLRRSRQRSSRQPFGWSGLLLIAVSGAEVADCSPWLRRSLSGGQ